MIKLLNTTVEEINKRLSNKKIQRLSIDLDSGTNYEILITPLGNDWTTNKLTGTDKTFFAIGIINYGCYPFRLNNNIGAGYLATKLNLPFPEAEELTKLLNKIKVKFYDKE